MEIQGKTLIKFDKEDTMVFLPDYIQHIGESAGYDTKLWSVWLSRGLKTIDYAAFAGTNVEIMTIPDSVEDIDFCAFKECNELTRINIPKKIKVLKCAMFEKCKKLEHVELPEKLEEIELCVFKDCISLKKLIVPDTVKELRYLSFSGCVNLKEILWRGKKYTYQDLFEYKEL